MKRKLVEKRFEKVIYVLEIIIAILIAIGIIIGLFDLVKYFFDLWTATPATSYELFEAFLAYALLLIVGIELILMILYHSTEAILELVLFVIARKMLIYSHTMLDLVLGTISIAIVFATLKYLVARSEKDIVKRKEFVYASSTKMADILEHTGFHIPNLYDDGTVNTFINRLAEQEGVEIKEGVEFAYGDALIKVLKVDSTGTPTEVTFTNQSKRNWANDPRIIKVKDFFGK